jgi:hypothetical protein
VGVVVRRPKFEIGKLPKLFLLDAGKQCLPNDRFSRPWLGCGAHFLELSHDSAHEHGQFVAKPVKVEEQAALGGAHAKVEAGAVGVVRVFRKKLFEDRGQHLCLRHSQGRGEGVGGFEQHRHVELGHIPSIVLEVVQGGSG